MQVAGKAFANNVLGYALRFLSYNSFCLQHVRAESPVTPDVMSDMGILDIQLEFHLTKVRTKNL